MSAADVVVVGGGAAGCASAYFLAREGLRVTLVEARELASGASGAAAGMLAPLAESLHAGADPEEGASPLVAFGRRALAAFPALCAELKERSGVDPEFEPSGLLLAAGDETAGERLARAARRGAAGLGLEWLDAAGARAELPGLAPGVRGALFSPTEAHVRSPLLARAYAGAARDLSARVIEGEPVLGLALQGDRVVGVRTAAGTLAAGQVVLCTGAHSREWAPWLRGSWSPPIEPVRGQIVSLDGPEPGFRPILWHAAGYLVPKRDGSLVVGATEERVGFDARVTVAGVASLLEGARRLLPRLDRVGFRGAWAGLRPGSPDGLPGIGPVPGVRGLLLAAGHHRNGVLLSPVTGESIAALALGKPADPATRVFDPARWASAGGPGARTGPGA